MLKNYAVILDLSEIRAILDNLAIIDAELRNIQSNKRINVRAIELNLGLSEEDWTIIFNRDIKA